MPEDSWTPPQDAAAMSDADLQQLRQLIAAGKEHAFYDTAAWHRQRAYVLRADKYECQMCKSAGRYRRAVLVHHVQHLRDRPDLALKMWVRSGGKWTRQLVSLCRTCHNMCHPEWKRQQRRATRFETVERWD